MNTIDRRAYEGDIASRLRHWRGLPLAHGGELFEEAADEIERLRNGAAERCETAGPAPAADGTGWPTSGAGPALTDEEREAISLAYSRLTADARYGEVAATLKALLERVRK